MRLLLFSKLEIEFLLSCEGTGSDRTRGCCLYLKVDAEVLLALERLYSQK